MGEQHDRGRGMADGVSEQEMCYVQEKAWQME